MTAVTCDFDFFMIPLVHKISNSVLLLLVTHYLVSTFELIIPRTHLARFSLLFPRSIISAAECAAITIYVQEVN